VLSFSFHASRTKSGEGQLLDQEVAVLGQARATGRSRPGHVGPRVILVHHLEDPVHVHPVVLSQVGELVGQGEVHVAIDVREQLGQLRAGGVGGVDPLVGVQQAEQGGGGSVLASFNPPTISGSLANSSMTFPSAIRSGHAAMSSFPAMAGTRLST
jgi:hypothetical protein